MFNKNKNEKELMEMMGKMVRMMLEEGLNGECEITLKNRPGEGMETHLKGDTMTIILALVGTLKTVMKDSSDASDEDLLDVVRILWDIIGGEKEELK